MRFTELQALMQAVLDGEATPAEVAELERQLATDARARAEFDDLRRLFEELAAVPRRHPPEGLVAAVTAALPGIAQTRVPPVQLSPDSGVLAPYSDGGPAPGAALTQQEQQQPQRPTLPPQRSVPMTQPHPPYSAKRKAWIGAGIALVAVAIVVRFGFDSVPKSEDVAGTVVPAQRYRAQVAGGDIQLGDQTVAQLMQNDAFVKLIRDPQIQAMAREPGFVAAARLMQQNPELARLFVMNSEAARALAAPETARAMEQNAEAMQSVRLAAEAAQRLQAAPDAQKALAANQELSRYVAWLAEMSKVAPYRLQMDKAEAADYAALNASFAKRFAEHAAAADKAIRHVAADKIAMNSVEMQRFMEASAQASRMAMQYVQAADYLLRNKDVAQFRAEHAAAARLVMQNPEAARVLQNSEAARVLAGNAEAAKLLLASPEAARMLQNPEAARLALNAAAERNAAEKKIQ